MLLKFTGRKSYRWTLLASFVLVITRYILLHGRVRNVAIKARPTRRTHVTSADLQELEDVCNQVSSTDTPQNNWTALTFAQSSFDFEPIQFLPNFRNPCWCQINGEQRRILQCLPAVFLAGLEKCGTTDLYSSLTLHPMIATPQAKEPHFWGKFQFLEKTFGYYLKWFLPAAKRIIGVNETIPPSDQPYFPMITIDGSPGVLNLQYAWRTHPGIAASHNKFSRHFQRIWTPLQLRRLLPNARYVVILRDPVDRLYSSYLFYPLLSPKQRASIKKRKLAFESKSPQDFHEKVVDAIAAFNKCFNTADHSDACFFLNSMSDPQAIFMSKLQLGIYWIILREWIRFVPPEKFIVVNFSDYVFDKASVTNRIFEYLGLPSLSNSQINSRITIAKYSKRKEMLGPMLPETRSLLTEFYEPHNKKLQDMIRESFNVN